MERLNEWVTLYEGRCEDVIPTLTGIDAVVTDPPYGIGFKYSTHDDKRDGYAEWCAEWFAALKDVCDGPILVSCGVANIGLWHQIEAPRWVMCWYKPAAMGRCPVGFNNWEPVLVYGGRLKASCDVIRAGIKPDEDLKDHPCPKPIEWARQLIRTLNAGTILDPFAGSGTTGIAAMFEKRKCILIERDPAYCDIIRKRVEKADCKEPGNIFATATM